VALRTALSGLWDGITPNGWQIGDAQGVFELLWLLATIAQAWRA
jgi:hypothetical protein